MRPAVAPPRKGERSERSAKRAAGLCLAAILTGLLTGCAPKKHIESERNT